MPLIAGKALIDPIAVVQKVGIPGGARVADFGCGRTGHFIFPISKIVGETGVVYAIDIIKNILVSIDSRVRSEGYDNVHTIWSDIEKYGATPIPEKSLDAVFIVNVFSMLRHKTDALREAYRLLKDAGKLVVVDWRKKLGTLGPSDGNLVDVNAFVDLAVANGFRAGNQFDAGDYHFCLVFNK